MSKLTHRQRIRLADRAFAIPEERKYPIFNIGHARNALARVSAFGTEEEKRRVRLTVLTRYPQLEQDGHIGGVPISRLGSRERRTGSSTQLGKVRTIPGVGVTRRVHTGRIRR
jgi:hypothetical protein